MQAIEMIVFFIASVVIASLILLFIGNIDPQGIYSTVERLVFPKPLDPGNMLKVTKLGFAGKIGACWEACAYGAKNLKCGTFYISDEGLAESEKTVDVSSLEATFRKYNYCIDCNVSMPATIELPAIAALECRDGKLEVSS